MDNCKNIEISEKNLFLTGAIVLSGFLLIFGIAYAIYGEFIYFKFNLLEKILLFLIASAQFIVLCFTKKLFEFNPNTKEYRVGFRLFSLKHGAWKPFSADCSHFTFQRYEENIHYTFGGLANKYVSEEIFELRKIYKDQTFEPITSGSNIRSVAAMVTLGKVLSSLYNLPFYDHVKGLVKKSRQPML